MKVLALLALVIACAKEPKISSGELFIKAFKGDPGLKQITSTKPEEQLSCSDYAEGCVAPFKVQLSNGLQMIAVEFGSEAQAKYGAKKIRGLYHLNWVFDDVVGEPQLERFAEKYLEAKKP